MAPEGRDRLDQDTGQHEGWPHDGISTVTAGPVRMLSLHHGNTVLSMNNLFSLPRVNMCEGAVHKQDKV